MDDLHLWRWDRSLGAARPGERRTYAVDSILFGLVRDRCFEIGLNEGATIRLRSRSERGVVVELENGELRALEYPYAWFVRVEPSGDTRIAYEA